MFCKLGAKNKKKPKEKLPQVDGKNELASNKMKSFFSSLRVEGVQ